jgi:hypothetical protein
MAIEMSAGESWISRRFYYSSISSAGLRKSEKFRCEIIPQRPAMRGGHCIVTGKSLLFGAQIRFFSDHFKDQAGGACIFPTTFWTPKPR